MRLVVDTSILIDYLRGGKKGESFINEVEENMYEEVFLPTVVIFELFSGKSTHDPKIVLKINNLIKFFQKIVFDEKIAIQAGLLYRDVKQTLQVPDYIIAASALSINAQVVTLNEKHFSQIPNLNIFPID